MNSLQKKCYVLSLVLSIMFLVSACSSKDSKVEPPQIGQTENAEIMHIEKAATSFWSAIKAKDAKAARAMIYAPDRAQLGMLIEQDIESDKLPPVPDVLDFEVEINADTAIAIIKNTNGIGCDLIKSEGQWWVYSGSQ